MANDLSIVRLPHPRGPLGLLVASLRITLLSPLHVLRGRRLIGLALLAIVPPAIIAIALALGHRGAGGPGSFREGINLFYINAVVPLVALFLAGSAIGDDVDDGTVLYLRLRPVPRSSIVIGRFLAAWISTLALVVPSLLALYLLQVGSVGFEFITKYSGLLVGAIVANMLGAAAYCAMFLFLGLFTRRGVVYGVIFVSIQDAILAIPGPGSWLSVNLFVATVLDHFGVASDLFVRKLEHLDEIGYAPTYGMALLMVFGIVGVLLAATSAIFASNEYLEKPGE